MNAKVIWFKVQELTSTYQFLGIITFFDSLLEVMS